MKNPFHPVTWLLFAAFLAAPLTALAQSTPASISVVSPGPIQTIAGQPVKTNDPDGRPTVEVKDALGNPVSGVVVNVSLNKETFLVDSTTSATTDSNGRAVFSDLRIGKAQGGYVLQFAVAGAPSVTVNSSQFPVVAAAPSQVEVVVQPVNSQWNTQLSGPPTVLVKDRFGNPANPDINVTAVLSSGTFTSTSTTTVSTGNDGRAVFSNLTPANAGNAYTITFTASSATGTSQPFNVTPKTLTIGGSFTAANKVYDGNNTVTSLNASGLTLIGVRPGDVVSLTNVQARFAQATVGTGLVVSITSAALTGAGAGNYELSLAGAPTTTANITAKTLTLKGSFVADHKIYDSTTDALFRSNNLEPDGVVNGDVVFLSNTKIAFVQATVGTGIRVNVASSSLTGAKAANYTLSLTNSPFSSANITQSPLLIKGTFTAKNKIYDKKQDAEIDENNLWLDGIFEGDEGQVTLVPVAYFVNANVGTWEVKLNQFATGLTGAKATNYRINYTGAPTTTATITPKPLQLEGNIDAASKRYDGTTAATLTANNLVLIGVINGDIVTLDKPQTVADFVQANVGTNIEVGVTSVVIMGRDSANYQVDYDNSPVTEANITPAPLTIDIGSATRTADPGLPSPPPSYTITGLVPGDTNEDITGVPVVYTSVNRANTTVGIYANDLGIETNGSKAGNYTITMNKGTLTVTPAALAKFVLALVAVEQTAGANFNLTITAQDQFGNTVTSFTGKTGLTLNKNAFSTGGGTTPNFTAGVLSDHAVGITKADTGYIITATETGGSVTGSSNEFAVKPAPASKFTLSGPSTVVAGVTSGNFTVTVYDQFNNVAPVSGATSFSLSTSQEAGTATFAPTPLTLANGSTGGTFTYRNTKVGTGTHTITAAYASGDSGLAGQSETAGITVTPAPLAKFALGPIGPEQVAGVNINLTITAQDQFGNTVTSFTSSVDLSLNKNNFATGGGTTPVFTAGVLSNHAVGITKADAGYIITATSGLVTGTSNEFAVKPAPASKFTLSGPSTVVAGVTSGNFTVTVYDQFNNVAPVSGATSFSLSTSQEAGTATFAPTPLTLANGSTGGTFTYRNTKVGTGTHTITAEYASGDTGLAGQSETADISVSPAAPDRLVNVSQPIQTVAGANIQGDTLAGPAAALEDAFGNRIGGKTVSVALNNSSVTLFGTSSGATDANGVIQFADLSIRKAGGGYSLNYTLDESPGIQIASSQFNIIAAAASKAAVVQQPTSAVAGATITPSPTVLLTDPYDNPALGPYEVVASLTDGTALFGTTRRQNDTITGLVVFDDLSVQKSGTYTMRFTPLGDAIDPVDSAQFTISPDLSSAAISMVEQPSQTVAGVAINPAPRVLIQDQFNNPVPGYAVTPVLSAGSFAAGGAPVSTGSDGSATFSGLSINTAATGYTIAFSFDQPAPQGTTSVTSAAFDVVHAALARFVLAPVAAEQTAGDDFDLTITAQDQFGNTVTSFTDTVDLSLNKNNFATGGGTTPNFTAGVLSNHAVVINKADTDYVITATSGLVTGTSNRFAVKPAAANSFTLSGPASVVAGVTSGNFTVTVYDAFNNVAPVSGATSFSLSTSQEAATATFAPTSLTLANGSTGGTFTYRNTKVGTGTHTITAAYASGDTGLAGQSETADIAVTPAAASKLEIVTQPSSTAQAGVLFGQQPAVRVTDEFGNPLAEGFTVTASIATGGPALIGALTASTSSSGVATFTDLGIGGLLGQRTLQFSAPGLLSVVSTAVNVNTPGAPAALQTVQGPRNMLAGQTMSPAPSVRLEDAYTNVIAGATVEVTLDPAGKSFAAGTVTTATTGSDGVAAFPSLKIEEAFKTYRLRFTHGAVTRTTGQFAVNAGTPSTVEVTTEPPSTGTAGVALNPAPVVTVKDTFGNAVPGANIVATLNTPAFTAGSTVSVSSGENGQAVFGNLVINTAGTTYEITFQAQTAGTPSAISQAFVIEPDAANASIAINQQPGNTVAGQTLAGPPTIRVADPYGNAVSGKDVEVTLLEGTFASGTTTKTSGMDGVISFDDLVVEQADNYRLRFAGKNGFAATKQSDQFTVSPAAAAKLGIATQPVAGAAGALLSTQPVLRILDEFNNLVVSDDSTGVTVAIQSGASGVLGGTVSSTAASGVVTFDNLTLGGLVSENYVLRFTAQSPSTIGFVDSDALQVTAGSASIVSVINQPVSSFAGQPIEGLASALPVKVKVTDAFTNPLPGVSVTPQPNGFVFAQAAPVATGANGEASFDSLVANTAGNGYSITFKVNGGPEQNSAQFSILPGDPAYLVVQQQPSNTEVGNAITPAPAVKLTDAYSNILSGFDVSVVLEGNTTKVKTGANGVATFNLVPQVVAAGVRLTFDAEADGMSPIQSVPFDVLAASAAPSVEEEVFGVASTGTGEVACEILNEQLVTIEGVDYYEITLRATVGHVYAIEATADLNEPYKVISEVTPVEEVTTMLIELPPVEQRERIYFWRISHIRPVDS